MKKKNTEIISPKTEDYSKKPLKNWKRCIDDYPKEYFNPQKKALDGNIISFSIYPYLKAKSEALHVQLSDAQNKTQLTKKQIKRIAKIPLQIVNPGLS